MLASNVRGHALASTELITGPYVPNIVLLSSAIPALSDKQKDCSTAATPKSRRTFFDSSAGWSDRGQLTVLFCGLGSRFLEIIFPKDTRIKNNKNLKKMYLKK